MEDSRSHGFTHNSSSKTVYSFRSLMKQLVQCIVTILALQLNAKVLPEDYIVYLCNIDPKPILTHKCIELHY